MLRWHYKRFNDFTENLRLVLVRACNLNCFLCAQNYHTHIVKLGILLRSQTNQQVAQLWQRDRAMHSPVGDFNGVGGGAENAGVENAGVENA